MFQPITMMAAVVMKALGSDDEREPKEMFEQFLRRHIGDGWMNEVITHGVPALAGLDLSSRVGWHNIMYMEKWRGEGPSSVYTLLGELAIGPTGGAFVNAFGDGVPTTWVGWERAIPIKAVKDLGKAVRYTSQGVTDKSGRTILAPTDIDGWEILWQGMGFGPRSVGKMYDRRSAVLNRRSALNAKRREFGLRFFKAKTAAQRREIYNDVDEWNASHPYARISRSTLVKSRTAHRAYERNLQRGIPTGNKRDRDIARSLEYVV